MLPTLKDRQVYAFSIEGSTKNSVTARDTENDNEIWVLMQL